MKKLLIIIFSFCFLNVAFSQNKRVLDSAKFSMDSTYVIYPGNDTVYLQPQVNAGFKGGQIGWNQYLLNNINIRIAEDSSAKIGEYLVNTIYIINSEGKIEDIELINNPGYGTGEELVRVLKASPLWIPAEKSGNPVKSLRSQEFTFTVSTEKGAYSEFKNFIRDTTIKYTEVQAEFPVEQGTWSKYLIKNLKGEIPTINGAPPGSYTVKVRFVVDKDGSLINIEAITNPGYGTVEEVLRLIKASPKWTPGIQNGKTVKSWRTQNISCHVEGN